MLLLSSADFFKINIFKACFQEHYQTVEQFGSRSGSDLGPNCLQRLYQQTTKVATSMGRVNHNNL